MPTIDIKRARIACKIIYYGPGLSGKTANIRYIDGHLAPGNKGRLVSLPIRTERTDRAPQVDLLPVRFGRVSGFDVTYNLCSAPGDALSNSARRIVLKAADGIVFVADSSGIRMPANLDSLDNLQENLDTYEQRLEYLPHVIQYNKRDARDVVPVAQLRAELNVHGVQEFPASTLTGQGIIETLRAILELVRSDIQKNL